MILQLPCVHFASGRPGCPKVYGVTEFSVLLWSAQAVSQLRLSQVQESEASECGGSDSVMPWSRRSFSRHIEFRMDLVLLQLGHRTWMDTALGSTGQHVE